MTPSISASHPKAKIDHFRLAAKSSRLPPTGDSDVSSRLPSVAACPLLLLILAMFAHAPALPLAAWPVLLLAIFSRWLPARQWVAVMRLTGLLLTYTLAGMLFGWLDSNTLRLSLLLVLALKWAESKTQRDFALSAAAACVALAIGLLQWGDGIGLLMVTAAACLLVAAYAASSVGRLTIVGWLAWLAVLRSSGHLLLTALPLAAILFLFFPRIPGPLWDIALTFGLPLPTSIEKSNQGLGVSTRLKPGQTQTGASDGEPVLIAEFRDWVPPTSLLYWRGPVFYDFDGQEWQLDQAYNGNGRRMMHKGWRSVASFNATLKQTAQKIRYQIRLTPHGGLWLYGLDLPASLTSESFVGPDWQVLAHMPVTQEMSYSLSSWLEWTDGGELDPALRQRAIALPAESNPRLLALGQSLAEQGNTDAIARKALTTLAQGGFRVRDRFTPPAGNDALDSFWFETREGNAEFFAAAYVFLMRAAGVPARLVTGYRGGKLMALTDYVVVKRSHAHAWVEIWEERKGWRRIDPVDVIAPERFATNQAKPKEVPKPIVGAAPPPQSSAASAPPPGSSFGSVNAPPKLHVENWKLPDLSDWLGRWVFRLSAEQQQLLLGGKAGGFAWVWLLAAAAIGSGLLLCVAQFITHWRQMRRQPAAQRAWEKACRLLAKYDLAPLVGECPSTFSERIALRRPDLAKAVRTLGQAYASWRYAPAAEALTSAALVSKAARFLTNLIHSAPARTGSNRRSPES